MKPLKRRVAALESAGKDDYQPPDMSFMEPITDALEANRNGRPFSTLPPDYAARPPPRPPRPLSLLALMGPDVVRMIEQLRRSMAADPIDFADLRRETVREIEAENRARERRERQRAKRPRKAERKRTAAVQPP
jgi:hypothetical protein